MKRHWKHRIAVALTWLVRLEQLAAVGLLVMILVAMGLQVVARYVFHSPIPWSEEVARLCMIWLTFIASSFVAARHQHIAVDLFGRDGHRGRSAVIRLLFSARLVHCLVLISTLLLLIGGMRFVWRVYPVASPAVGVSMTYWYGAASVGLGLIAIHALADLLGISSEADR